LQKFSPDGCKNVSFWGIQESGGWETVTMKPDITKNINKLNMNRQIWNESCQLKISALHRFSGKAVGTRCINEFRN
jgi:hypothetical protein